MIIYFQNHGFPHQDDNFFILIGIPGVKSSVGPTAECHRRNAGGHVRPKVGWSYGGMPPSNQKKIRAILLVKYE